MPQNSPDVADELVTVAFSADHYGVTERTVYNWIADGTLPAYRVGTKAIRIKRSDLDALLQPVSAA